MGILERNAFVVKIKFNNAGRPETIKVEGEKHLTLSNRQLSVHLLNPVEYKLGWSIDRITLVGDIKTHKDSSGMPLDLEKVMTILLDSGHDAVEKTTKGWNLKDRHGEHIAYVEYLDFDNTRGRIDFNPNKLESIIRGTLKEFIHYVFDGVKFSRVDVACDIINVPDEIIDQYSVFKPVKSIVYRSKGGAVETRYWGSSSSERQVRLYNKKKERIRKRIKVVDGIDTWWRFEAQLRGSTSKEWVTSVEELLDTFTATHFIPDDIDGMEKLILMSLIEYPERFGLIGSKATKSKYRKLISRVVENDELTQAMLDQFQKDIGKLDEELGSWLGYLDVTENYNPDDED